MGLRELKAQRTRRQIIDVALDLFIEQGYDETTMEQIAERAEIGSSTLYRYFPSKDLLILDRLVSGLQFGDLLRQRPAEEPLEVALGGVIRDSLALADDGDGRFAALRRIIDTSPVPRAKLWDFVTQLRTDLEVAIAERTGLPGDDLFVVMTARTAFVVYEIAGETWWDGDHGLPAGPIIDGVLARLRDLPLVIPAPASGVSD